MQKILTTLATLFVLQLNAAEFSIKVTPTPVPKDVSATVKKTLGKDCIQLSMGGKPWLEFWLRAPLPLKAKPAKPEKALDALATATLMGVVRVHKSGRDYRDDDLYQGVFTMRYGKIPGDGNHLGATDFPYFAVLIPAKKDPKLDTYKTFKTMTKASLKDTASEHPMIFSLRPAKKAAAKPTIIEPAPEHKSILLAAVGALKDAKAPITIPLQIVFEGFGEQ
jgi:hypothetical protein